MNYSSMTRLDNRVAIVTGGASGIGFEAAKALKECGAKVVIVDINQQTGKQAAGTLGAQFLPADLTNSARVREIAGQVKSEYGRIDIAFNNAGICNNVPGEDQTDEEWLRVININLNSVYYCCREFGKVMLTQGKGSIINTASMSGIVSNIPQPQSAYNASKAGVIMLTKSLAVEWAPRNVRVNSISPGCVGREKDLSAAIVYLACRGSTFTTGTDVVVDGAYACA